MSDGPAGARRQPEALRFGTVRVRSGREVTECASYNNSRVVTVVKLQLDMAIIRGQSGLVERKEVGEKREEGRGKREKKRKKGQGGCQD